MPVGKIRVGKVEIIGLSDAVRNHNLPLDQLFPSDHPVDWEVYSQRYPSTFGGPNVWIEEFGCYLLRSQGHTVLVDTGIGPANAPFARMTQMAGQLLAKLQIEGIQPEDVDRVVFTHLHPDHVGWNVLEEGGRRRLTFPRARYIIHEADWAMVHSPELLQSERAAFVTETITPVQALGALELISGERRLTDELTAIPTPGHTPGHTSVLVVSDNERAVILGDVVAHPLQVTEPDVGFFYDMDLDTAKRTRYQWLERMEAEGMTAAASHFPEPGFGRVVRLEGRRYWQAL